MNYVDNDDVKNYDDYNNDCEMLIMERLLQILCKMLIMVRLMIVICKMLINVKSDACNMQNVNHGQIDACYVL